MHRGDARETSTEARYNAVAEERVPPREIAETIGLGLKVPVVAISPRRPPGFGLRASSWPPTLDASAGLADDGRGLQPDKENRVTTGKTIGAILVAATMGWLAGMYAQTVLPPDIHADSRNRLPPPRREDFKDADLKLFDDIMSHQQGGLNPGAKQRPLVRMYSPKLAKSLEEVHGYLRNETRLGDRVTTIAVLTTSRELTNQYEWTQWEEHARIPKDARYLEPKVIDAIKYCRPLTDLDAKDAAVIAFGRELIGARKVSPETFAEVLRLFGRHDTVDLEEVMGLYGATAAELVAFDQQLNDGQKPLLPANAKSCMQPR